MGIDRVVKVPWPEKVCPCVGRIAFPRAACDEGRLPPTPLLKVIGIFSEFIIRCPAQETRPYVSFPLCGQSKNQETRPCVLFPLCGHTMNWKIISALITLCEHMFGHAGCAQVCLQRALRAPRHRNRTLANCISPRARNARCNRHWEARCATYARRIIHNMRWAVYNSPYKTSTIYII